MNSQLKQNKATQKLTLGFVVALLLVSSFHSALADTREMPAPQWSGSQTSHWNESQANESYMISTTVRHQNTLNDEIFGNEHMNAEIRAQYDALASVYEYRSHYGLTTTEDDRAYSDSMKALGHDAMGRIRSQNISTRTAHAQAYAEDNFSGAKEPIAAAALMGSLYSGRSFRTHVAQGVTMESSTCIKNRQATVSLLLPGVRSTVQYAGLADGLSASLSKDLGSNISANASTSTADPRVLSLSYGLTF